jgi:hypothetical protein
VVCPNLVSSPLGYAGIMAEIMGSVRDWSGALGALAEDGGAVGGVGLAELAVGAVLDTPC